MKGERGGKEKKDEGTKRVRKRSGRGRRKIKRATAISSKSDLPPSVLTFFDRTGGDILRTSKPLNTDFTLTISPGT